MQSSLLLEQPIVEVVEEHSFEIGVVYKDSKGRLFLATDKEVLITFIHRFLMELERPTQRYTVMRNVSVREMCRNWGIHLAELDNASKKYFAPSRSGTKRRLPDRFGRKKEPVRQEVENVLWAEFRTFKTIGISL